MTRKGIYGVLLFALVAGAALAYGTYDYLQNMPTRTVSIPTRPVVVAAVDLSLGAELDTGDIRTVDWPEASLPVGVKESPGEVVGRGLMTAVLRNEPILEGKLAPVGSGAGLPPVIPEGMRAMSVRVNEVIGVAGYVLPGTKVDVLATASPTDQRQDTTSKVVLSNVLVLTAGTKLERDTDSGQPMQVSVVTLLVDPEQSEKLTLASTEGKIQLALRNPIDEGSPETSGIRPTVLFRGAEPPPRPVIRPAAVVVEAPPPAPPPVTIEMIRGDARATEIVR